MKKPDLSPVEKSNLKKALIDTPTLNVGGRPPRSINKGYLDTPLFNQDKQTKLFDSY
jgi:hypothetical protein